MKRFDKNENGKIDEDERDALRDHLRERFSRGRPEGSERGDRPEGRGRPEGGERGDRPEGRGRPEGGERGDRPEGRGRPEGGERGGRGGQGIDREAIMKRFDKNENGKIDDDERDALREYIRERYSRERENEGGDERGDRPEGRGRPEGGERGGRPEGRGRPEGGERGGRPEGRGRPEDGDRRGRSGPKDDEGEVIIKGRSPQQILTLFGFKGVKGVSESQRANYRRTFGFTDTNRDGKHSRKEYVENGRYMTPQARAGIFQASDSNKDDVVSEDEYVENRIITDEAKEIFKAMDANKDNKLTAKELLASKKIADEELAGEVFKALDTNSDGSLVTPEYLRVWGVWARS